MSFGTSMERFLYSLEKPFTPMKYAMPVVVVIAVVSEVLQRFDYNVVPATMLLTLIIVAVVLAFDISKVGCRWAGLWRGWVR